MTIRVQAVCAVIAAAILIAFGLTWDGGFRLATGWVAALARPVRTGPLEARVVWTSPPAGERPSSVAAAEPTVPEEPRPLPGARPSRPDVTASALAPAVLRLKPFTVETRYLSLPGYLRFLFHEKTGRWISPEQAARVLGPRYASERH